MKVSAKASGKSKSKCKIFYQNFKCTTFYINLPSLICLTKNILLKNKYCKIRKYFFFKYFTSKQMGYKLNYQKGIKKGILVS